MNGAGFRGGSGDSIALLLFAGVDRPGASPAAHTKTRDLQDIAGRLSTEVYRWRPSGLESVVEHRVDKKSGGQLQDLVGQMQLLDLTPGALGIDRSDQCRQHLTTNRLLHLREVPFPTRLSALAGVHGVGKTHLRWVNPASLDG